MHSKQRPPLPRSPARAYCSI